MKVLQFCLLFLFTLSVNATQVVLVNPSLPGNPFWDRVTSAFVAAGEDLSFKTKVIYGKDDRLSYYQAITDLITASRKPDFVLLSPYSGNAFATFELLEKHKIPFVTLERTLATKEQKLLDKPGKRFTQWLGEIYHDNVHAGRLLSDTLIDIAKQKHPDSALRIVGLSGSHSGESSYRAQGLIESVKKQTDKTLLQIVPAYWSPIKAEQVYQDLLKRYKDIDIVWAASDGMALGALKASEKHQNKAPIIAGGIDWTKEAINSIDQGRLAASVGGHFLQAAFALVKLYDYQHQVEDAFAINAKDQSYKLAVVTKNNLSNYAFLQNQIEWQRIDFKHLTKTYNANNNYIFAIDDIVPLFTQ